MAFEITTALRKMLAMDARKKVIQGATSSGKTYGIIPIIYDKCTASRIKATVIAETLPAVKEGCVDIFKNFMMEENRWNDTQWNESSLTWTCFNGSKMQFKSFDSVGKAKAGGKRDLLFINEANHVPYEVADALMIRSKEIWMDFNADAEFWAHTNVLTEPNSEFLKLTYLDNEAIPVETLEDLLNRKSKAEQEEKAGQKGYWWNWWQVYGLGEIGSLQGVVFSNWSQIDLIPEDARIVGYGMDFGFTNDPTTLTAIYEWGESYIFDELIYAKGLLNNELANLMKSLDVKKGVNVYADSADPKTIKDLSTYGFKVKSAVKGQDSIIYGIHKMQEKKFFVTKRSVNLLEELRRYIWATDRSGNTLNKPVEVFNHVIDGIRYYFTSVNKSSGKYMITRG